VLTVDDDTLILMGTAAMLEDLGHRPLEAGSGAQALELLRGGAEVDLVLTDQAMPGMTGLRLAATVRAEFPGLPIVLATGYAELPADADSLVAARLGKPFTQQALAAILDRVAGSGGHRRQ
jgi:CheY-like chemotaxis protein